MRKLTTIAMALFFLTTGCFVLWENYHKPRLMVLHSYDSDYVWTREVDTGLNRILDKSYWLTLRHHYMRTKKFSSKKSLRRAAIAAQEAIEKFKPDVLLAVDDYAQKLVASHYINNPKIKIVFAGVNGSITPYGYDKANNVTGILERKQFAAVREAISILYGDKKKPARLAYISDSALSGIADVKHAEKFSWAPLNYLGGYTIKDFEHWQKKIHALAGKIDFLLVSGYRKLPYSAANKEFVPHREVLAWTIANLEVPVIGLNVFNSRDGAMISVGVSPYEQGEVAARMALNLLSGHKQISEIPVQKARQYVISMSESSLKYYKTQPPQIFEAFARATDNFYK